MRAAGSSERREDTPRPLRPANEEQRSAPEEHLSATEEPRAAAFFDLDKTIIATTSATAFSRPFLAGGLITRGDMLRTAYAQFLYLVGGADAEQTERLRARLSAVSTGWDVDQVRAIVSETLHEHIDPVVYAEAVELIGEHHAAGRDVVVVSASGSEVVEPIAALIGADHVVATRLTVEDGRYTGSIDFYCYGENKALAMRELAERESYDLEASYAYSDSITDAPMLEAVGRSVVVNPDRALRRLAEERGWQVARFTHPQPLSERLRPVAPAAAVGGAALALGVGALVWRAVRRRRGA
ncbi:MAG: HAD family hydrolase [Actinomycetales bacterium]|nr:HAD family hydrolase [Actinomycetales bacterium]